MSKYDEKENKFYKSAALNSFNRHFAGSNADFGFFYQYGGVLSTMKENEVQIFEETTRRNRLNVEREFITYWIEGLRDAKEIPKTVENILKKNNCTAEDIAKNPELNNQILSEVTEELIDVLHYSFANGIYMVLDGPASVNGDKNEQAGVYIRDLDVTNYAQDHSDLFLERGTPSISQKYGIALGSSWEYGFNLKKMPKQDFYRKPHDIAITSDIPKNNASACAYLGSLQLEEGEKTLSYSMPLILSDHRVIGVFGGDLSKGRVRRIMENDVDKRDENIITMLAKSTDDDNNITPVIFGSNKHKRYFDTNILLECKDTEWDNTKCLKDKDGKIWYASIEPLKIYDGNTPFSDENWSFVRLIQKKHLFENVNYIQRTLIISVVASLLIGFFMLLVTENIITNPIRNLMIEIKHLDFNHKPYLEKIQIEEIDKLIEEINRLNSDVEEHALKISRIIDATDMKIGVFEYKPNFDKVYCSHLLLKLLGIPYEKNDHMYQYLDKDFFVEKMSLFRKLKQEEDEELYEFKNGTELQYIRIKIMETEGNEITGVLMDVTPEVLEKRRLKQERDCDLLTGIYNNRGFHNKIAPIFRDQKTDCAAVVMWDMDNLKYVNDTYGHEAGDEYIRLFAAHLLKLEEDGGIVGRRSGDEFIAVLYGGTEQELLDRIQNSMNRLKHTLIETQDGEQIPLRASTGVAWYPKHGRNYEELIRYADFAMYMSKHKYRGIVQEFDMNTYRTNSYLLSGREEMNRILDSGDVNFTLQPIVTAKGDIYGYEVLIRPPLKKLKNISEFLHLIKSQGKFQRFEELTWFGALKWVSERESKLAEGSKIFINSFSNIKMTDEILEKINADYSKLLGRVVLELTETEEADYQCIEAKKAEVRKWNMLLALDDYGTGYSNDSMLLQIEPNIVKMDIALIHGIHENQNQQMIAKHLIDYCHSKNILVVAEGIETEEELRFLMKIHADLFQGFYLARPDLDICSELNPEIKANMQRIFKEVHKSDEIHLLL